MDKLSNAEIVVLLYRCHLYKSGEDRLLAKISPDGLRVDISNHSTCTHCNIYLTMPGEPDLLIWRKNNWTASGYHFNDKGKIDGLQPGCQFARPMLDSLLETAQKRIDEIEQTKEKRKAEEIATKKASHKELINRYRERFSA